MKTIQNLNCFGVKKILAGILTGMMALHWCNAVSANIFTITDTNDSLKVTSLRGAVIAANHIAGKNVILLGKKTKAGTSQPHPWIYQLTLASSSANDSQGGDLDFSGANLTIIGVTSNVVISAAGLGDRVIQIQARSSLTLSNLTLTGGTAPANIDNGNEANGGGIYNSGVLKLIKCTVTGNASGAGGYTTLFGSHSCPGGNGGGIFNQGSVQLITCLISNNITGNGTGPDENGFSSGAGNGGAIYNIGTMTLTNCRLSDNACGQGGNSGIFIGSITPINSPGLRGSGGGSGGGIYNAGRLHINACTIDNNVAGLGGNGRGSGGAGGNGGGGGDGGGIYNAQDLSLTNCTLSDNFAGEGGTGGHSWYAPGGTGGDGGNGGGIFNAGTMRLTACTVALNSAGIGGNGGNSQNYNASALGGTGGFGGGLLNAAGATNAFVRNSLLALNTPNVGGLGGTNTSFSFSSTGNKTEITTGAIGAAGAGCDVFGDFTSQGFNLVSIADDSTGFTNGVSADQVGSSTIPINPLLDVLQMNGGYTPTHALLVGSPAIDQGNSFGLRTDQRGHKRPQNNSSIPNASGGNGSDIGAYEADVP